MKEENIRKKFMLMKLSEVQKRADRKFQLLRRLEESTPSGVCRCISCGRYHHYKEMDAGHFIPRAHKGTRYSPLNTWPQCKFCNYHKSGNHAKFRENLLEKIGREAVEKLERIKDNHTWPEKMSWREWCIEVYIESKNKIKKIKLS